MIGGGVSQGEGPVEFEYSELWEKKTMKAKAVIENPTPITFGIANPKLLGQDNLDFELLLLPLKQAVCTKLNSKLFS
jgi:hypothetical protein